MNSSLKDPVDEGWSVQIYGRDRRLICSLYPSHGWMFLVGLLTGVVFTAIIASQQANETASPSTETPTSHQPMFQVD